MQNLEEVKHESEILIEALRKFINKEMTKTQRQQIVDEIQEGFKSSLRVVGYMEGLEENTPEYNQLLKAMGVLSIKDDIKERICIQKSMFECGYELDKKVFYDLDYSFCDKSYQLTKEITESTLMCFGAELSIVQKNIMRTFLKELKKAYEEVKSNDKSKGE